MVSSFSIQYVYLVKFLYIGNPLYRNAASALTLGLRSAEYVLRSRSAVTEWEMHGFDVI
jgi:hypothetical protein